VDRQVPATEAGGTILEIASLPLQIVNFDTFWLVHMRPSMYSGRIVSIQTITHKFTHVYGLHFHTWVEIKEAESQLLVQSGL
jgi:hypothetical protein